jgi:hypothetical protein
VSPGANEPARRQVDKTGLISWRANKYSVPMAYQRGRVGVMEDGPQLHIVDLTHGEVVAIHALCHDKGRIVRNNDHYRDHQQRLADLERAVAERLGDALGRKLCDRLRTSLPRHYKDQLTGALKVLKAADRLDLDQIAQWAERDGLTAGKLKERLQAARLASARGRDPAAAPPAEPVAPLDLTAYSRLGRSGGQQEVTHGAA